MSENFILNLLFENFFFINFVHFLNPMKKIVFTVKPRLFGLSGDLYCPNRKKFDNRGKKKKVRVRQKLNIIIYKNFCVHNYTNNF